MKVKYFFLTIIVFSVFFYIMRPMFLSTKVIGVHQNRNWTDIVVKNFPITDQGRIEWWKENATQLKLTYNIPIIEPDDGSFDISIWDAGNGYQEEVPKQDWMAPSVDTSYLICFDDMKTDTNCVEKDLLLSVSRYRDPMRRGKMLTDFLIEGNTYRQYDGSEKAIKIEGDK